MRQTDRQTDGPVSLYRLLHSLLCYLLPLLSGELLAERCRSDDCCQVSLSLVFYSSVQYGAKILKLCYRAGVRCSLNTNTETGCSDCSCDEAGTVPGTSCEKIHGYCACKSNVAGRTCNQCVMNAFNLTAANDAGCQPCDCDVSGTASTSRNITCDQNTGNCTCLSNRVGRRCDTCAPGKCHLPEVPVYH